MRWKFLNFVLVVLVLCALCFVGVQLTGNAVVGFSIASDWNNYEDLMINCSCPLVLNDSFFGLEIYVNENVSGGSLEVLGFNDNPVLSDEGLPDSAFDFIEINACSGICTHVDHLDLRLPYSNESGVAIEDLTGYYFNESSEAWEVVNTTFDENASMVILHLDHLSLFAVGERVDEGEESGVGVEEEDSSDGGGGADSSKCNSKEGYKWVDGKCVFVGTNESEEKIPEQLFDISWSLEDSIIQDVSELVGVAIFESFGSVPTPISLTFIMLDGEGNEIYLANESIIVTTEEIVMWNFFDNGLHNLDEGDYVAVLKTLYNVDVYDEFRQEFSVRNDNCELLGFDFGKFVFCWYWWVLVLIVVVLFFLILFYFKGKKVRARRKRSKN